MEEPIILVESEEQQELEKVEESDEPKKPKRKLSKKAKLAIIISTVLIALGGVTAALIFFVFNKEEPVVVLSDVDILTSGSWEKEDAPSVIWTFLKDGTGELTTNRANYYDTKWSLDEVNGAQTLKINTDWLYPLEDTFTFSLNREANTFTVVNQSDETKSVFVPLGTAEKKATEQSEQPEEYTELEKTEE